MAMRCSQQAWAAVHSAGADRGPSGHGLSPQGAHAADGAFGGFVVQQMNRQDQQNPKTRRARKAGPASSCRAWLCRSWCGQGSLSEPPPKDLGVVDGDSRGRLCRGDCSISRRDVVQLPRGCCSCSCLHSPLLSSAASGGAEGCEVGPKCVQAPDQAVLSELPLACCRSIAAPLDIRGCSSTGARLGPQRIALTVTAARGRGPCQVADLQHTFSAL